ncbi:sigma 54-interacting transcriptional regulator [Winogradskyella maritima]|uniref:Sigma-54 interaction domain-containing protein n=1 Tax=Winogradskyella maritima TaxID=1517766 RepID=A0ABV8AGD5_9FLAO|nr:sigma 54-interacting transcriptional regulator [Winogradskyella maritima]
MKTSTALQDILLHISKAVINIRSLEDFHTTIMNDIGPHILFDDAVLVLFSEDKTRLEIVITMAPQERKDHPKFNESVYHQLEIANSPFEAILKSDDIALFSLTDWLKNYPTYPGIVLMKDTNLNHTISIQLKNVNGVFASLLFHFEKKPSQPVAGDFYHGIKDQLAMALSNILANEEIAQEKHFAETLLSISEALVNIRNREDLYKTIRTQIYPIINFDDAVVIRFDEDLKKHTYILTMSDENRQNHPLYKKIVNKYHNIANTPGYDVLNGEDFRWYTLEYWLKKYPDYAGLLLMKDTELKHTVVLQLKKYGKVFGGLLFHFKDIQDVVNDPRKKYYSNIANQISVTVNNIIANEEIVQEKQFAETLLSISEATTNIRDRYDLYTTIMDKLRPIVHFDDAVAIVLSDDGAQYNHLLTVSSQQTKSHPNYSKLVNNYLPLVGSPIETMFQQEDAVRNYDLYRDWLKEYPNYPGFVLMKDVGLHHTTILKLMNGGTVFGLLLFHFETPQPKDDDRWKLYPNIADQLSIAISNVITNEKVLDEKQQKETLLKISEAATKIRDRETLYHTIMMQIKPIVNYDDAVAIILSDDKTTFQHILTMSPDERKDHPLYDTVVHKPIGLKNTPISQILKGLDFQQYEVDQLLEEYPHFEGLHLMKDTGLNYSVVLKLKNGDEVYGIILFHFKEQQDMSSSVVRLYPNIADQLSVAISNLLANEEIQRLNEKLTQENEYLEEEIKTSYNFTNIIGASEPMQQVFQMVEQVASSSSTVIVLGETGTGKELIARAIHDRSPRNKRPLIKINCATLPAQLLESELFGHEKGSFTGATERRIGKFELAHQGTIFLDEIGELPLELQSKLLRVLQEREIERLGGSKVIAVDTRIITATNRNLEKEVQDGNFRADLFFRLNVFPIILPPLRNRVEDIPALAEYFLERFSKRFGKKFKGIAKETIRQMKAYQWPGNVRELEHLIERAMIIADGGLLKVNLAQLNPKADNEHLKATQGFSPKTIKDNERALIIATLKHCGGRVRGKDGAAQLLDINPSTLESRMRKLGIKKTFTT